MTDLLTPATPGRAPSAGPTRPRRPFAVGAGLAGVGAACSSLLVCFVVGLAGWFASDAGSHGDTRDAIRVGADAWLLAHGAHLRLSGATIAAIPLGLTLFCAYVAFRMGRVAGSTCAVDDFRAVVKSSTVLAGAYAVTATLTAVLASVEQARPHPGLAFLGGFALSFLAGGLGVIAGSGRWESWRDNVPESVLAIGSGVVASLLLMFVAGALLVFGALLLDFGAAANVLARLHVDVAGGLLYTLVAAAAVPNAILLAGAYMSGPGFVVGTGTLVSPSAVVLGHVPAFPLLAALPDEGPAPEWTIVLATVPVLVGALASAVSVRRHPVPSYEAGAIRGLVLGGLGGAAFGILSALAGGSVGPGRMADVGALAGQTMIAAGVAMGVGGLIGGLATTWWVRRPE